MADSEYHKFTGKRINLDVVSLSGEMAAQLGQFIINYWNLDLLGLGFFIILWKLYAKYRPPFTPPPKLRGIDYLTQSLVFITVVAATVVGIRGGLQQRVLTPSYAYATGNPELGSLTLNSAFTLVKSKWHRRLKRVNYFKSRQEVNKLINKQSLNFRSTPRTDNVVILILESFGAEFLGSANNNKGYTPFLDSLTENGLFFKNGFANGKRSNEALPSILFSVPNLMDNTIASSNYQNNTWIGLGSILKKYNYHASFFHGAARGSMTLDSIAKMAGFDHYYALEDYPDQNDYDGHWGIFDEPYLQYALREINKFSKPFVSVIFTLSSHQPYAIPIKYTNKFPKGTLEIHETIGYVDHALQEFFKQAQQQEWYANTLFVITGDHTQQSASERYNHPLGKFMVPLLFYHPSVELQNSNPEKVVQHIDIMPSVLDFLGRQPEQSLLFGRSVFNDNSKGLALLYLNGVYWSVNDSNFLQYMEPDQAKLFDFDGDLLQKHPILDSVALKSKMQDELKAYIQYYRNGLIDNKLYDYK